MTSRCDTLEVDAGDGLSLHVERSGNGAPILLLHGFTGSTAVWTPLRKALDGEYTIIAVDLPGHGKSATPSDHSRFALSLLAHDLAHVLDQLGVTRTAVIGYSMGGRAALQFALSHPERISALVLESVTSGIESQSERASRIDSDMALADMVERDGVPEFVHFWERLPIWSSQASLSSRDRAALRAQRLDNNASGLANSLRGAGAGAHPSVLKQLSLLSMPTLLVAGALDPKFASLAHAMEQQIQGARAEIVPGAGHTVHLEKPAEFRSVVTRFVDSVPRSGREWSSGQRAPLPHLAD